MTELQPQPQPEPLQPQASPPPPPQAQPASPPPAAPPWNSVVLTESNGPSILIRVVWFIFVGWWLSGLVIAGGYILAITILGLPLAFAAFNLVPVVMTLRARTTAYETVTTEKGTFVRAANLPQHPLILRAIYFLLVGWWLGAIWIGLAWAISLLIVTLPIGVWMMNRIGAVMTLLRY